MNKIISLTILLSAVLISFSQNRNYYAEAEQAFNKCEYTAAAKLYKVAYVMTGIDTSDRENLSKECAEAQNRAREYIVAGNIDETKKWFEILHMKNPNDEEACSYLVFHQKYVYAAPNNMNDVMTIYVNNVPLFMKKIKGGNFKGRVPELNIDCQRETAKEWTLYDLKVDDFKIGLTEVTQELWEAVMGESMKNRIDKNGADKLATTYVNYTDYGIGANYPMYYINDDDILDFITKLNEITGMKFRLPTPKEWIFAELGGLKSIGYKYSGSNDLDKVAWYQDNCKVNNLFSSHPVASKLPNELGLYDMTGNVSEATSTRANQYGGCFLSNEKGCQTQNGWRAFGRFNCGGFRLAMD